MGNRVHGHQVRQMIIASGQSYTRESLISTIVENFGTETRFFSCAADNMTAAELVAFFESRGKLSAPHFNFSQAGDIPCDHHD